MARYDWDRKINMIMYRLDMPMCKLLGLSFEGRKTIRLPQHHGVWMWYRDIMAGADRLGVAPEVLVDEPYYFFKSLVAPYRLAFKLGRKYENLVDFYYEIGREYEFIPGKMTFYTLLTGNLGRLRHIQFWVIDRLCREAGLPLPYLFTPYRRLGQEASFGVIHNIVAALKDYDVAVLAGFAKMLAQGDIDQEELTRLLEWRKARREEGEEHCNQTGAE